MAADPDVLQTDDVINKLVATRDSPGYLILLYTLKEERQAALEEFLHVDEFDSKEIARLKAKALRFEYFLHTIDELIEAARDQEKLNDQERHREDE